LGGSRPTPEQAFRDWYERIILGLDWRSERDYRRWVQVLRSPEVVSGFRQVRRPRMEAARRRVERLLAMDPESEAEPPPSDDPPRIPLPVLRSAG
jgi:hypothetical protein